MVHGYILYLHSMSWFSKIISTNYIINMVKSIISNKFKIIKKGIFPQDTVPITSNDKQ